MRKNSILDYLSLNISTEADGQEGSQPTSQATDQPGSQAVSQPTDQPESQTQQNQPDSQATSQPNSQPSSQMTSQPTSQQNTAATNNDVEDDQVTSGQVFKGNNYQEAANAIDEEQAKSQPVSPAQSPTIVISSFVCTGASTWAANNEWVKDLDSMIYSKKPDGSKADEFPGNYIDAIRWQLSNCNWKYLLVSSHQDVRAKLKEAGIKFYLFYPALERKDEIIKLCQERGNDAQFIQLLQENYEGWISEMSKEENAYALQEGEFLCDELFEKKFKFLKQ